MKLRHIFAALAIAVLGTANAVNVDELRIYINPGHGSWTERAMGTEKHGPVVVSNIDTTGFCESNTNLWKAFGLFERLKQAGLKFDPTLNQENENPARLGAALDMRNNIVFSHVKCGPYPLDDEQYEDAYSRLLSEISYEVYANNFDMFISIHSNANTDGDNVNFPLYLYRGEDNGGEKDEGSIAIATKCWPYHWALSHNMWSAYSETKTNFRGDWDFYGSTSIQGNTGVESYLGALKHGVKGFLVEGYFHTYQPARHRYMNPDICAQEGIAYARGIRDYFELSTESTGSIIAIVRDMHEKWKSTYYNGNGATNDKYKPLNNVTAKLMKGEEVVATYVGDDEYNGAIVFDNVEPGTYTLAFSCEGYKDNVSEEITVVANHTTSLDGFLEIEGYVPPKETYFDYPDELTGVFAADEYNVTEEYANLAIAELEGTTIRRVVLRGDVLYILAVDANKAPVLLAYDTKTKAVIEKLGTSACTNTTYMALADIQVTADGVLVGSSIGKGRFDSSVTEEKGEPFIPAVFYKWAVNEETGVATGEAQEWITSEKSSNMYRAYTGGTFLYKGTIEEGEIYMSAENASEGGSTWIWIQPITIIDGAKHSDAGFYRPDLVRFAENDKTTADHIIAGYDYTFTLSPLHEDYVVISSEGAMPVEMLISDDNFPTHAVLADGILNKPAPKVSFFKYAGSTFMVAPDEVDGKAVLKLINVTEGFDKAKLVKIVVTSPETATDLGSLAYAAAVGRTAVEKNDYEVIENSYIDLHLVNGTAATKYTTKSTEQPAPTPGAYAYALALTQSETTYTASFKLSGDAQATVVLVDAEGAETEVATIAGVKGDNTVEIDATQYPDGVVYNWKVVVESGVIPAGGEFFRLSQATSNVRGGAGVDRDPESDKFGTIYGAYGKAIGLFEVDPTRESVTQHTLWSSTNNSSPYRIDVEGGKVYASDWSDPHSGLWVIDPANPTAEIKNYFEGTRNSSGAIVNGDVEVASSLTGAAFVGEGENRKLFAFNEDIPGGSVGFYRYDVGTAESWGQAGVYLSGITGMLANQNVEVSAGKKGVFVSQNRSAGNNTESIPAFVYLDMEGNLVFNSASLTDLNGCASGGVAINEDETLFAVANANGNVQLYDVAWSEEGVPSFTYNSTIEVSGSTDLLQFSFDPANNLYAYSRQEGLIGLAPASEKPVAVTPAKAALTIVGAASGVDAIKAATLKVFGGEGEIVIAGDAQNVSVYNVAGQAVAVNVKASSIEVAAGVYVVVADGKAYKVVVK